MPEQQLKSFRINDFNLVPTRLLAQIKTGMPFNVEMARKIGQGSLNLNLSQLYVFHDEGHVIRGFLWLSISPVSGSLYLDAVSFDKEFQDGRTPAELVYPIVRDVYKANGFEKVFTQSSRPKAMEKHGWLPSKITLMEAGPEILEDEGEGQWQA